MDIKPSSKVVKTLDLAIILLLVSLLSIGAASMSGCEAPETVDGPDVIQVDVADADADAEEDADADTEEDADAGQDAESDAL